VLGRERVELKSPAQFTAMRRAGLVVADMLDAVAAAVAPGVSTAELDAVARSVLAAAGATSSFLGYHGFPAVICVSVNNEVVHGIPGPRRLAGGDLVSVDAGAIVDGWHGDAARTVACGGVAEELAALSAATEAAMWAGVAAARVGGRLYDIGAAVEDEAARHGSYGVVEEYVGHGIGTAMHMPPQVPNYRPRSGHGPRLVAGMALAIEPMLTLGSRHTDVLDDDWTVVTADGLCAAHWEHTVALTSEGPWVLTERDGGAARLGRLGVPTPASVR